MCQNHHKTKQCTQISPSAAKISPANNINVRRKYNTSKISLLRYNFYINMLNILTKGPARLQFSLKILNIMYHIGRNYVFDVIT